MNTETTMSPAEALEVIKRAEMMMPLGTVARAVWFEDAANARTAVAALIEREAALVAERDALAERVKALDGVLRIVRDTIPHIDGNAASVHELARRIDAASAEASKPDSNGDSE